MKTILYILAASVFLLHGAHAADRTLEDYYPSAQTQQGALYRALYHYNERLRGFVDRVSWAQQFPNSPSSKAVLAEYRAQELIAYQRFGTALVPEVLALTGQSLVLEKEPEKLKAQVVAIHGWLWRLEQQQKQQQQAAQLEESARLKAQQDLKNQLWLIQQELQQIRNQRR